MNLWYSTFIKVKQVYEYILMYASNPDNEGALPSYREIQKACGISSLSVLNNYMKKLGAAGYLRFYKDRKRYTIVGAQLILPMREFTLKDARVMTNHEGVPRNKSKRTF